LLCGNFLILVIDSILNVRNGSSNGWIHAKCNVSFV
jgi:hypothetical protein